MSGCEYCDLGWVDPHFSGMDREPCVLCNTKRWDLWAEDPYGMKRQPPCSTCGGKVFGRDERIAAHHERMDKIPWAKRVAMPMDSLCWRCGDTINEGRYE